MIDHHAMRKFHFLIAVSVLFLYRVAKWVIAKEIPLHDSIQVIPDFFRLTHVGNRGAALGLFAESRSVWKIAVLWQSSSVALVFASARLWIKSQYKSPTGVGL